MTRWRTSIAGWGVALAYLLSRTWAIYRNQLRTILVVAGGVVAVVDVILGVGLGQLTASYGAKTSPGAGAATFAATALVTTPLITAMLARAVLDVVAGDQPSVRRSVRSGLDLFAPLLVAVILWIGAIVVGLIAFVIPGLYVLVSWYFVAQAVVVDDRRGVAALARSGELVRGRWLDAALTGLAFQLAVLIPSQLVALVFDAAARQADAAAILVVGDIVIQSFAVPFLAIGATLFYLDLRARAKPPPATARS